MSLIVWTAADAATIRNIVGPVISQMQVPHSIQPLGAGLPAFSAGDVVLAMGTKAMEILLSLGLVPKNRTVNSLREKPIKYLGATFYLTFDPGIVKRDYPKLPDIQWDIMLASRVVLTGDPKPILGTYRWVDSFHELIEFVEAEYERTGAAVDVAMDLETLGLDEFRPDAWIVTISFTYQLGKSDAMYFEKGEKPVQAPDSKALEDYDYWEALWSQINWALTSPKISLRGANLKYDNRWVHRKWGMDVTNQKFDTLLVGSLLDENRSNSLKLHAKLFTHMGGYEDGMASHDMGRMDLVPKPELLDYTGGDTDVTHRVARVFKSELLKDKRLTNFYVKLLQPSAKVFERLERKGVIVDVPYYQALQRELTEEIHSIEKKMVDLLPNKLRIKHKDTISEALSAGKNPLKASLLTEFMFTPMGLNLKPQLKTAKTGAPSTALEHLMMFADHPVASGFIDLYKEYTSATKTLSTYVTGFLAHLRSDGRFHGTYLLGRQDYGGDASGTVTGRLSCKDPALQTVPKHTKWTKKLRRAFIAPPGKAILQLDYSQGELRIAACVAQEPTMIKAYKGGADLHSITAAQLNGYSLEEFMAIEEAVRDELRSSGKAGNFGLLYGMQHKGFKEYAYTAYGVKMTEEEAFVKRTAFFELYSRLLEWHEESKMYAHKYEMVRSPLGRIRHLPLINSSDRETMSKQERQCINSPIQATLSDMMQLAMVRMDHYYGDQIDMFMMTHDSVSMYVPIGEEEVWGKRCKELMETLPLQKDFGWNPPLVFVADAEYSAPDDNGIRSLATLKKMKNL